MRTTTCPGPDCGSGTSSMRSTSGPPNSFTRMAFILHFPHLEWMRTKVDLSCRNEKTIQDSWFVINSSKLECLAAGGRLAHHAAADSLVVLADPAEPAAGYVLPSAENQKRNHRNEHPELGAAGNPGFRLPAEKLARHLERHPQADGQR